MAGSTLPGSSPSGTSPLLPGGLLPVLPPLPAFPSSTSGVVTAAPRPSVGVSPAAPGVRGFSLSPEAQTKLGLSVAKEVTKWFLTPLDAPTMGLSPAAQAAWTEYKVGEWADYSGWVQEQTPALAVDDLVLADNDAVLMAMETGEGLTGDAAAAVEGGIVEAAPTLSEGGMSTLSIALKAFGIVAALTDMGFVIAGKLPDAQKAVIATLDAAIIGAMFIPVYGWAIGLVLGVVRGIIGLFGASLFGPGDLSHAQREALEVQRTAAEGLNPWMQQVAAAMTPRELVPVLIQWTTGYCGGTSSVAVMTYLRAADTGVTPYVAAPGCYINQRMAYHEWPDMAALDRDGWALALVKYGPVEVGVNVQAGVAQHFRDDMNTVGLALLQKRLAAWGELVAQGATLDDLDALALEQRQTPHWNMVAAFFGEPSWHALVGWHVQDLWTRYLVTSRSGSLNDFARKSGYPTWLAMRDAVMIPYDRVMSAVVAVDGQLSRYDGVSMMMDPLPAGTTPHTALRTRLASLGDRLTVLEANCGPWQTAQAAAAQAAADAAASAPAPYYDTGSF